MTCAGGGLPIVSQEGEASGAGSWPVILSHAAALAVKAAASELTAVCSGVDMLYNDMIGVSFIIIGCQGIRRLIPNNVQLT